MNTLRNIWRMTTESLAILFATVFVAMSFYLFAKNILEPAAPLITALLFLGFTIHMVTKKQTVMALGGVVLYLASWPAAGTFGTLPAVAISMLGISLYFWGLIRTIPKPLPATR